VTEPGDGAAGAPRDARLGAAPGVGYADPVSRHPMRRLTGDVGVDADALLAEEVPVALVYNRRPYVVMLCSPTDLEDFAVGFTVSEEIAPFSGISSVAVERHSRGIDVSVTIPPDAAERLQERARVLSGRTGCGLCGVDAIDDAVRAPKGVTSNVSVTPAALWRAGEALGAQQLLNRDTHAIHAAAWATPNGDVQILREDVGRHNALDKALGALLRAGVDPASGFVLMTSRASVELVQKAAMCDVSLLAAVSRPTALAVRMAERAGMTLVGLLRGDSANVYTHPGRVSEVPPTRDTRAPDTTR